MPSARVSPLAAVARLGRFGAAGRAPGVTLSVRHPLSIVTVIARRAKDRALASAVTKRFGLALPQPGRSAANDRLTLHSCGPEQWFAVAEGMAEGALCRDLAEKFAGLASCSDQSHGRVVIRIAGPRARDVLAKGTPVDLHPLAFGPGRSTMTQMAHAGVHLAQSGDDTFELSVFRGFSESFWEWLTAMAEEYGYGVA